MEKEKKKTSATDGEKKDTEYSLSEKLIECEKQRDEYLQLSKRLKADFVNLKKDTEGQVQKTREFANEMIIMQMLPVLDSMELALKHTPDDLKENDWVKGILSVKGQLDGIFKMYGVEEIVSVGEKFDPNLHEAVTQEDSDKGEDIILEELQKGYTLKGKVIRPAKVKVSN
jgi:molecular chaperone GrpE